VGKQALFFALTGYSTKAVAFADQAGIALIVYSPSRARLTAANQLGREVLRNGIPAAFRGV